MVETTTQNYGWVKPEIQHSPSTWGGFLNADLDAIDAVVFANQQASVPIGSGALWFTSTPPANWLICDGSSLDTTAYAALFAVLGYTFGGSGANFNLPNPLGKTAIGANATYPLASTGGEATHVLTAAEIPAHTHPITQVAHSHTASQAAHQHVVATGGHSHTISTGSHSHGLDHTPITLNAGGNAGAAAGWGGNATRTDTAGDLGGSTNTVGNLGGYTDSLAPAVTVAAATPTGPTATGNNTGGGAAHNNMQPYLAISFIVRYK